MTVAAERSSLSPDYLGRSRSVVLWLAVTLFACTEPAGTPQAGPDPGAASPARETARQAILDTVRGPVESELGQPVLFDVHELRTDGEWAFLTAVPLTRDRQRIDYSRTKFAEDVRQGFFDDWLCALVRKQPDQNWSVVALSIGSTDAPFVDWPSQFGVPKELVMPTRQDEP